MDPTRHWLELLPQLADDVPPTLRGEITGYDYSERVDVTSCVPPASA
jgi:hypothetical protein